MTPPQAQPVSVERPRADTARRADATGAEGPFVINLRSSTTPMALSQPSDPALARFKFFMSRRLEDGRERFRLHMGYFETLAEAEEWLTVVREIYPGAWAGEAPGKRLKARAPEPAVPEDGVSNARDTAAAAASAPPTVPAAAAGRGSAADAVRPPAIAAHAASASLPRSAHRAAEAARPTTASEAPRAPALRNASETLRAAGLRDADPVIPLNVPVLRAAPEAAAPSPRSAAQRIPATPPKATQPRPSSAKPAASPSKSKPAAAKLPLSNVREVLAALDETGATRQMPALIEMREPPAAKPSELHAAKSNEPRAAMAPRAPRPSAPPRESAPQTPEPERSLSDTQVLKLLEGRRADGGRAEVDSGISLLKPDDTGTRRALKEAVATNAPVSFAVQLQWSVQSIDISKVPPLAIFSAYTLYTVEGSREGRRWYGLRLGFFSDAISAKQVAHYVRSEFNSVAVVPVSPQERSRASEGGKSAPPVAAPAKAPLRDRLPEPTTEFKLIDDEPMPRSMPTAHLPEPQPQPAVKSKTPAAAPPKRPSKAPAGRVRAREKRSPQTLEETLEILGADQLEIDRGRGEMLNDTGVRHLTVQVRKNSPFTRLLDRLAERARGK